MGNNNDGIYPEGVEQEEMKILLKPPIFLTTIFTLLLITYMPRFYPFGVVVC